jgi:metal-responsive CopG/Arc/MetJ family transcriptional regulator
MGETKGIAIRLDKELFNQIQRHKLPRNEIIQEAIEQYLKHENKSSINVHEDISDDIYAEVYSTLYNSEIVPLKQKNQYQDELISILQSQLNDLKKDKEFLYKQVQFLTRIVESKTTLFERIKKKIAKSQDNNQF